MRCLVDAMEVDQLFIGNVGYGGPMTFGSQRNYGQLASKYNTETELTVALSSKVLYAYLGHEAPK